MRYLIYGGSGGIGGALARALSRDGHHVHLVGRDPARLAAAAAETGGGSTAGDVLDPGLFGRVMAESGAVLDGLVYAVGSITLKTLPRLTESELLHDFRLNALGAALAVQAALPALRQAEGTASVVLFSSVAAAQGFASHASISMAKGAVEGLTLSLAAELAPKVRVNCVAPSLTRTPLAKALTASEQTAAAIAQLHPLQRLGEPEDIAGFAQFLLSSGAGWMTGQIIGADGGRSTLRTRG